MAKLEPPNATIGLVVICKLTTALCCMEDGCLGYPRISTVISQPLDRQYNTHGWQSPQQSHEPPHSPPGTCHTKVTVELRRKGRGGGDRQKDITLHLRAFFSTPVLHFLYYPRHELWATLCNLAYTCKLHSCTHALYKTILMELDFHHIKYILVTVKILNSQVF